MTSHSEKLTALGFIQTHHREWLQQFGQHGTEFSLPQAVRKDLFLLDDGTVIALGRWCNDMHVDEFVTWWRRDQEKKQKPVQRQKGLFGDE